MFIEDSVLMLKCGSVINATASDDMGRRTQKSEGILLMCILCINIPLK